MTVSIPIKEDLVQQQILQAAKRLFAVHGLARVTVDDVAKAVGKGRSSLYYYYKSKDEIFEAVFRAEVKEMLATIEAAVGQATTVEERIDAFFVGKLKVVQEKGAFFNALKVGMDADALTDFNKTKIAHHALIMKLEGALLTRILNEGIRHGELNAIAENDLETVVFVLLSSLRGLRNELNLQDNTMEIKPAIARFTRIVMHGLKN